MGIPKGTPLYADYVIQHNQLPKLVSLILNLTLKIEYDYVDTSIPHLYGGCFLYKKETADFRSCPLIKVWFIFMIHKR